MRLLLFAGSSVLGLASFSLPDHLLLPSVLQEQLDVIQELSRGHSLSLSLVTRIRLKMHIDGPMMRELGPYFTRAIDTTLQGLNGATEMMGWMVQLNTRSLLDQAGQVHPPRHRNDGQHI
jgi:hypothetical protein